MNYALKLHSKHSELQWRERLVQRGCYSHRQYLTSIDRVDDAIVPEACGAVKGRAFVVVLSQNICPYLIQLFL